MCVCMCSYYLFIHLFIYIIFKKYPRIAGFYDFAGPESRTFQVRSLSPSERRLSRTAGGRTGDLVR